MKKISLFGILCLAFISCFKEEYWSAGKPETRRFDLENYQDIVLSGQFDILLVQDSLNYALCFCGENIIDKVHIRQNNGLMELNQETSLNLTRHYNKTRIELHFKLLSSIQIDNCVRMESILPLQSPSLRIWDNSDVSELDLTVNCGNFYMMVSENNFGIYKINGNTLNSSLYNNGSAHFRTENLVADSCNFIHNGIGDCYVNAKRILTGEIRKNGNLFYKDYPLLKTQIENKNGKIFTINN
jgi:hypothetical protein